jgi:imidazolonepropionase-like amidohydrolase
MTRFAMAAFAASLCFQAPPPGSASRTLALVGGRIYPAPGATPIDDGVILIHGSAIAAIGSRGATKVPPGAEVIDCNGLFVTAGFQNSHVHFTEPKWIDAAKQPASKLSSQLEAMLTRYGFTTVVDTASTLADTLAIRKRVESGEVRGPRILTAGAPLFPKNGIPYYVKESIAPEVAAHWRTADTAAVAVKLVDENVEGGADIIKLFTGSWVERGRVLPMPVDVATAATTEAHRRGRLVFTHASNLEGLESALAAHVDVVAHSLDAPGGLTADHLRQMKAQNVSLIPTLKLFGGDSNVDVILAESRDFRRLGGQLLFGTDVGYLADYDPTREYELMARAGLSWRDILESLTTNPAARFGETSRRGRIAAGLDADLIVLGHDPAADARAFADVRRTIRSGRVLYGPPSTRLGEESARSRPAFVLH